MRNNHRVELPPFRKISYKKSFTYRACMLWNQLPDRCTDQELLISIKLYYTFNYNFKCKLFNIYCLPIINWQYNFNLSRFKPRHRKAWTFQRFLSANSVFLQQISYFEAYFIMRSYKGEIFLAHEMRFLLLQEKKIQESRKQPKFFLEV